MKKLLFISLLSLFLFSCSDDDKEEKACWRFYIENTDNIPCYKEFLKSYYSNLSDTQIDEMIETHLSSTYCDITESQAKIALDNANKNMKKFEEEGLTCSIIYVYEKVEPN